MAQFVRYVHSASFSRCASVEENQGGFPMPKRKSVDVLSVDRECEYPPPVLFKQVGYVPDRHFPQPPLRPHGHSGYFRLYMVVLRNGRLRQIESVVNPVGQIHAEGAYGRGLVALPCGHFAQGTETGPFFRCFAQGGAIEELSGKAQRRRQSLYGLGVGVPFVLEISDKASRR